MYTKSTISLNGLLLVGPSNVPRGHAADQSCVTTFNCTARSRTRHSQNRRSYHE